MDTRVEHPDTHVCGAERAERSRGEAAAGICFFFFFQDLQSLRSGEAPCLESCYGFRNLVSDRTTGPQRRRCHQIEFRSTLGPLYIYIYFIYIINVCMYVYMYTIWLIPKIQTYEKQKMSKIHLCDLPRKNREIWFGDFQKMKVSMFEMFGKVGFCTLGDCLSGVTTIKRC